MGSLSFITANPVMAGYDQQNQRIQERRKREQEEAIDAAYREGLGQVYERPQNAGYGADATTSSFQAEEPVAVPKGFDDTAADNFRTESAALGFDAPPQPSTPAPPPARGFGGPSAAPQPGPAMAPRPAASQPANPMGGVMQRLIATPGAGAAAFDLHKQNLEQSRVDQRRQDEMEKVAITALGNGDLETYRYWSQRAGLQVPEEIVQNAQARALLSRGVLLAEKFYRDDDAQAQTFVQAYMQSGGDVGASWQAAGAPRRKPNISLKTVLDAEGRSVLGRFDVNSGQMLGYVNDPSGQPVRTQATGAAGRPPAQQQIIQFYMDNGKTFDEAVAMANAAKTNPTETARKIYADAYEVAIDNMMEPEAARSHAQQEVNAFFQFMQQLEQQQGPGMGGAPAPVPGAGGPAMPTAEEAYDLEYDPETMTFR